MNTTQITMRCILDVIEEAEQACAAYDAKGWDRLAQDADERAEQHRQYARHMVREVLGVNIDDLAKAAAL